MQLVAVTDNFLHSKRDCAHKTFPAFNIGVGTASKLQIDICAVNDT